MDNQLHQLTEQGRERVRNFCRTFGNQGEIRQSGFVHYYDLFLRNEALAIGEGRMDLEEGDTELTLRGWADKLNAVADDLKEAMESSIEPDITIHVARAALLVSQASLEITQAKMLEDAS